MTKPSAARTASGWPLNAAPEELVAALRERLLAYDSGDDSAVGDIEALCEVGALLALTDIGDPTVATAAGLVLWGRSQRGHDGDDELAAALALLAPLWREDPLSVPEAVGELFSEIGIDVVKESDAWHGPALALARRVRSADEVVTASIVVELLRRVVAGTPTHDPEWGQCVTNLAMAVQTRFELTGSLADLDEAVTLGERALPAFAADDTGRAAVLGALAVARRRRFGATGDGPDIDAAVGLGRRAVALTPVTDPARLDRMSNLGVALQYRFEWTTVDPDGREATAVHRKVLAETPADDGQRPARLVNLAAALLARCELVGARSDLDEAIAASGEAAAIPAADDATRAAICSSLAAGLRARFHFSGASADLDEAVRWAQVAAGLLSAGHPDRAVALTTLGLALHVRARRQESAKNLDRSVEALRQAVTATPTGHRDRPGRLSNLGDALLSRADEHGRAERDRRRDLDEAVTIGAAALAAAGQSPRRHMYLSNSANALLARFRVTGDPDDLNEAVALGEEAVARCPADSPDAAAVHANLATARHTRFIHGDNAGDLLAAITYARRAASVPTGPTAIRVRAAVRWGTWASEHADWPDATAGLGEAVRQLHRIAPRELPSADQEFELARLGGIGGNAAAAALNTGDPTMAVRLLEQGPRHRALARLCQPATTDRSARRHH